MAKNDRCIRFQGPTFVPGADEVSVHADYTYVRTGDVVTRYVTPREWREEFARAKREGRGPELKPGHFVLGVPRPEKKMAKKNKKPPTVHCHCDCPHFGEQHHDYLCLVRCNRCKRKHVACGYCAEAGRWKGCPYCSPRPPSIPCVERN